MDVSDSHGNPSERNIFKEWFKLFTRKQKTINYNLILDFDSESFGEVSRKNCFIVHYVIVRKVVVLIQLLTNTVMTVC